MGVESMQAKDGGEHLLFKRRPTMEEFGDALKAYGVLFKALTGEDGKYTDFTDFLVRMGFVDGQGAATLDSLTTPTTAVYQRPHDKEAGRPPLFEHRTEITKIQPGVKIAGVEVEYEVPDSGI